MSLVVSAALRCCAEFKRLEKEPVEHISALPSDSNILEWHYLIHGPASSPYAGGLYHGKLVFPRDYPYRPPSILMLTPNGRFRTNTKLCLSMSDFHPETWNPLWSVQSILSGLLSFMLESTATYGSMEASDDERRRLAARSEQWNIDNDRQFNALFPQYKQRREERREKERRDRERQQQQDRQDREDREVDSEQSGAAAADARPAQDDAKQDDEDGEVNGGDDQQRTAGQRQRLLSRKAASASAAAPTDAGAVGGAAEGAGSAGQGQRGDVAAAAAAAAAAHPDASFDRLLIAVIVVSVAFGIVLLYT